MASAMTEQCCPPSSLAVSTLCAPSSHWHQSRCPGRLNLAESIKFNHSPNEAGARNSDAVVAEGTRLEGQTPAQEPYPDFPLRSTILVIGPVGGGKSSVINAMLGREACDTSLTTACTKKVADCCLSLPALACSSTLGRMLCPAMRQGKACAAHGAGHLSTLSSGHKLLPVHVRLSRQTCACTHLNPKP